MEDKINVNVKHLLKDAKKLILSSDTDSINKGLKYLKKVIKCDPENFWAFIYYGVGASKCGKLGEAVASFEAASHINIDSVECWKGMRSSLETKNEKTRSEHETRLLLDAYINLLRLETNEFKWKPLYTDIMTQLCKLSSSDVAHVLFSLVDGYYSKDYKHEVACKELSFLIFNDVSLLDTRSEDVLKAFQGWANFLDFSDRPDFCKKACLFLTRQRNFAVLSNFVYHTILVYGTKIYTKMSLLQFLIDIAFDCMDNAEKLVPLISGCLKEIQNVKTVSPVHFKLALCIVHFFEEDFSLMREQLENLSFTGDTYSILFLLKFLCKAKDYESVVILCVRFARPFSKILSDKIRLDFILCLMEALSCSNEVAFLNWGLKLGLKALCKYGENPIVSYHLCQAYTGLSDSKALYYLDKLKGQNGDDGEYLTAVLKQQAPENKQDSDKWLDTLLSTAYFDLINGNIKRSLRIFTKIGGKDKRVSDPFLILGIDSVTKGDDERAASCFHRAFSLRPLDTTVLKHYLDSLFRLKEDEHALSVLDAVWSNNFGKWHYIGEKALLASALIHSAKFDHEKSIRSFKHLIKLNPECMDFIEAISDEFVRLRRLGIAENYISRLVSDDPYDLHFLLLLTQISKLDVNYSCYFNHSVKCLNFHPDENAESQRVTKLILCIFINFVKTNSKLDESSHAIINKMCLNSLNKLSSIISKGNIERSSENEYLIALYVFLESHFLAALKMIKRNESVSSQHLLEFCIKAVGRVLQVYGTAHIAFWKLLADILLTSSQLSCKMKVFSWLVDAKDSISRSERFTLVESVDRIHVSIKCYIIALNLAVSDHPSRVYEFYFDISVALIYLSNHRDVRCHQVRYRCLRSSLQSCLNSFVHSDGINDNKWIHSNLLGVIVSMLGVRENRFKDHFSDNSMTVSEGIMLQNYATHLAKTGMYNLAEETYELAKHSVDMDYSSPWVGELLMQLMNSDQEMRNRIQYHLTHIGDHPLFKWILGYFLANKRPAMELHGGQYTLLNHIFPESECIRESDPSRLTLAAYLHEMMGNTATARRLYFRVLRLARHVDEDTYNVFLSNAVRTNGHCGLNIALIRQLDESLSPLAAGSLLHLNSQHISLPNINKHILFKTLVVIKNLLNLLSSEDENSLVLAVPHIFMLSSLRLPINIAFKVPSILEHFLANVVFILGDKKNKLRRLVSALDQTTRELVLKNLEKFSSLNLCPSDLYCLTADTSISSIVEKSLGKIIFSEVAVDKYSVSCLGFHHDIRQDDNPAESNKEEDPSSEGVNKSNSETTAIGDSCSYSKVTRRLRESVFPLPVSYEERFLLRRNKVSSMRISSGSCVDPKVKASTAEGSYLDLQEPHGCHSTCTLILHLLRKSVSEKNHTACLKYTHVALDVKCPCCLHTNQILPLISYLSIETKNARLVQKALHLYPSHPLLRKTFFLLLSRING